MQEVALPGWCLRGGEGMMSPRKLPSRSAATAKEEKWDPQELEARGKEQAQASHVPSSACHQQNQSPREKKGCVLQPQPQQRAWEGGLAVGDNS